MARERVNPERGTSPGRRSGAGGQAVPRAALERPASGAALDRPASGPAPAHELDPDQRAVVDHPGGPLLVLAGPGTGKTTTLVELIVQRVLIGACSAEEVLALTFSRAAAAQLRSRIAVRLGTTTRGPVAATFHSYCLGLLARYLENPPRLLTGAEQDLEVRRLLRGELEDGAPGWPAELRPALATSEFARQLRDLLSRALERGLRPDDLAALSARHARPAWVAAAGFWERYEARFDVADGPETFDYAGLVHRAADLLAEPAVGAAERAAYSLIVVDEYQDTDPAQERVLGLLAGGGRDLVVVGDPDQSIYGFRGADVSALTRFPERFRTRAGAAAPVVALRTCRRMGASVLAPSRAVAAHLPAVAGQGVDHRCLHPAGPVGHASIRLATSEVAQAQLVADLLRRAHLVDGRPWGSMAVLLRAGGRGLVLLRRTLLAAGVPVATAAGEIPLAQEPAVRGLLVVARIAVDPGRARVEDVHDLLAGPLGRVDILGLRRIQRALRAAARVAGDPRGSAELLLAALTDPAAAAAIPARDRGALDRPGAALAAARTAAAAGAPAEQVLWEAWEASGLGPEWAAEAGRGGARAAAARADLAAVAALFETAADHAQRFPAAGAGVFLEDFAARELPEPHRMGYAPTGGAVDVITAHRSKGLEWDLVVVYGLQEGSWPDLRLRGSLLGVEELADAVAGQELQVASARARALAEERRLCYVALTRAREELVLCAVAPDDPVGRGAGRPSRFLEEVDLPVPTARAGPDLPLTLPGLVARLRRAVCFGEAAGADSPDGAGGGHLLDPATHPVPDPAAHARAPVLAAAQALATLAAAGVPGADPATWWGLRSLSDATPLLGDTEEVVVRPSQAARVEECPLRWLLEVRVGLGTAPGPRQVLGSALHGLAVAAAAGRPRTELSAAVDGLIPEIPLEARWQAPAVRQAAQDALTALLDWLEHTPRACLGVEVPVDTRIEEVLPGRAVRLLGRVDRLEVDEQGRTVVIDFKTGAAAPTAAEVTRDPQLGLYQLALRGADRAPGGACQTGGGELVHIGRAARGTRARVSRQPPLEEDPDPTWAERLLARVVRTVSGAVFEARPGPACRTCPVIGCCPAQPEGTEVGR